jgi:16S rRNA G966 N2-methylase RsmD
MAKGFMEIGNLAESLARWQDVKLIYLDPPYWGARRRQILQRPD